MMEETAVVPISIHNIVWYVNALVEEEIQQAQEDQQQQGPLQPLPLPEVLILICDMYSRIAKRKQRSFYYLAV